ncbi:hypothetical protein VTK73DRAFT_3018 [Phialemonium thermophilum]|uniref:Uncharacterized protein n=1 Tax=Phialemonium thermophilum TaxID=223376 RepID=A0ABR3VMM4_9PEZI
MEQSHTLLSRALLGRLRGAAAKTAMQGPPNWMRPTDSDDKRIDYLWPPAVWTTRNRSKSCKLPAAQGEGNC